MRTFAPCSVASFAAAIALAGAAAAPAVHAQDSGYLVHRSPRQPAEVAASWTPERAAALEPIRLESFASLASAVEAAVLVPDAGAADGRPTVLSRPQPPTAGSRGPEAIALPIGRDVPGGVSDAARLGEPLVGKAKLHFTSSRVLIANHFEVYPLSTVGRLLNADGWCSASVVAKRILVTAAHCVHDGRKFLDDIAFVPGFTADVAPLGTWPATAVVIPKGWASTQGKLPNRYDYAFVELVDAVVDGEVYTIRDVVGALGLATGKVKPNHVHVFGYPSNIDQGKILHEVTSGDFVVAGNATVGYGSDMGTGSSGGPWIQNFGIAGAGQKVPAINTVVGVTSYIVTDPTHLASFTSSFDKNVTSTFQAICRNRAGNC